ncbi:MAG: 2Fe-2S iron-sulfur cluster-binding protein [Candidatus Bathyarchaeota archaeon]|nr:2Fe-2S iron-sulfur cluster-binding protein [Candidatus Bathyarchaeota archaeon]MDH5732922.1 2Fe-2S iron-sulfur cluster-binding protein [Candidatus Bathyarchaeota archaeon]
MATKTDKIVEFQIRRFDRGSNRQYVSTFQVPVRVGMTVLDVFSYIKENVDGTLTFRHQCRMGQCGSCGVMVNGKPMLACYTQVLQLGVDTLKIEPLSNLPVIKDLVVDIDPFFDTFEKIKPLLIKRAEEFRKSTEFIQSPSDFKKYWDKSICTKCSLCYAACPASIDVQFLGPSSLTANYRFLVDTRDDGASERLKDAAGSIWLCTSCSSCTLSCPKEIDCALSLDGERGLIVEDGLLVPRTVKDVLESAFKYHNPLRMAPSKRIDWSKGMEVKELSKVGKTGVLYFVGCAASYDVRNQEMAKAMAQIFRRLGEDFAVLGNEEWCCGDHILRLGERGLFEELAEHNVELFKRYDFDRVVTLSPHCLYVFNNEKPYTSVDINAQHYTQFLAEAIEKGKLKPVKAVKKKVTYHDPCFLGKRSGVYDEPRRVLKAIPGLELIEFGRVRENSFCCGGGAGRVWTEEATPENRPCVDRVKEALKMGVEVVATACPFCVTTFEDAVKVLDVEDQLSVKDISELLVKTL